MDWVFLIVHDDGNYAISTCPPPPACDAPACLDGHPCLGSGRLPRTSRPRCRFVDFSFFVDFSCPDALRFFLLPLQWAAELEALCLETADERTCLEATSYSAWMAGNLLLEKEEWREALDRYSTAHRICQELGKVTDPLASSCGHRYETDYVLGSAS